MEPVPSWNTMVMINLHFEDKSKLLTLRFWSWLEETDTYSHHKKLFVKCCFPEDNILVKYFISCTSHRIA